MGRPGASRPRRSYGGAEGAGDLGGGQEESGYGRGGIRESGRPDRVPGHSTKARAEPQPQGTSPAPSRRQGHPTETAPRISDKAVCVHRTAETRSQEPHTQSCTDTHVQSHTCPLVQTPMHAHIDTHAHTCTDSRVHTALHVC